MKDSKTGERQVNYRWRCKDCKKQHTVRTGTVFEESRIELRHWCFWFLACMNFQEGSQRRDSPAERAIIIMLAVVPF
jgi:transposase-like protein